MSFRKLSWELKVTGNTHYTSIVFRLPEHIWIMRTYTVVCGFVNLMIPRFAASVLMHIPPGRDPSTETASGRGGAAGEPSGTPPAGSTATRPPSSNPNASTTPNAVDHKLTQKEREMANRRFVIWCSVNLRPPFMRNDVGFKLFAGILSPAFVESTMRKETLDSNLTSLHKEVVGDAMEGIRAQRQSCLDLGYRGPFLGGQLDLMTVANDVYMILSVSYAPPNSTEITRVALATRVRENSDLPGDHAGLDIREWVKKVSC